MEQSNTTTNAAINAAAMIDGNLHALASLLDAFKAGVIVPAADIPHDQRAEIRRELHCMGQVLNLVMETRELPSLPGSLHLQRPDPTRINEDALIERSAAAMLKRSKRDGFVYEEPCKALSTFNEATQILTLRNVRGDLGTFRYNAKTDRLTYVEVQA